MSFWVSRERKISFLKGCVFKDGGRGSWEGRGVVRKLWEQELRVGSQECLYVYVVFFFFMTVCCNDNAAITVIDSLSYPPESLKRYSSHHQQIPTLHLNDPLLLRHGPSPNNHSQCSMCLRIFRSPKATSEVTRMLKGVCSFDIWSVWKVIKTTATKLNQNQYFSCNLYSKNQ